MIRYKLTDAEIRTNNGRHLWTPGEWFTATEKSNLPCTTGVVHYYDSPRLAVMFNPVHANITSPRLWTFETRDEIGHDGLKGWCKTARIVEELPLPVLSIEQATTFAIHCAMQVCTAPAWLAWANGWLSGADRSAAAAWEAARMPLPPPPSMAAATAAATATEAAAATAMKAAATAAAWVHFDMRDKFVELSEAL
jgi:hypothetical protein